MAVCKHVIYLTPARDTRLCWVFYPSKELYLTQVQGVTQIRVISQKFTPFTLSTFMGLVKACLSSPHGYSLLVSQDEQTNFTLIPDFSRGVRTINLVLGSSLAMCLTSDVIDMILQTEDILGALFQNPHVHSKTERCGCTEANTFLVTPCASAKWPIDFESL